MKIRKVIAFVLAFCGFSAIGTLAHEAGHLIVNNLLGGSGEIYFNYSLTAGHMDWATLPPYHIWFVYLAGGIFAAFVLFLFFWLPARLTPTKADVYIETAVIGPILGNLFYAPVELFLYTNHLKLYQWGSITAGVLAGAILCALYIWQIVKWINYDRTKTNQTERVP